MRAGDEDDLAFLIDVIEPHGWLGSDLVGADATTGSGEVTPEPTWSLPRRWASSAALYPVPIAKTRVPSVTSRASRKPYRLPGLISRNDTISGQRLSGTGTQWRWGIAGAFLVVESAPRLTGGSWRTALAGYREPRLVVIFLMGFASGLPLALTGATLAIWLTDLRLSLTSVGLFAVLGVPYNVKFLWSPLFDRMPIPVLTRWLGRRRSWLLVLQLALIGVIVALGCTRPVQTPMWTALAALGVAFFSASQDVVIDAYRIETAGEHEQGVSAAMTQYGYRLGMLASGAGALFLAAVLPWSWVYAAMAGLLVIGVMTTLLAPEPRVVAGSRVDGATVPNAGVLDCFRQAVLAPFVEFFHRRGVGVALLALTFIVLYTLGDAFAGTMANPFYVTIGFSKVEIATVTKVFGLGATLAGVFLGGLAVSRYGVLKALVVCGICQAFSNLMFAAQALAGHDVRVLVATIAIENLTGGMASAALVAYLSVLCNVAYTATQYALFTSFMALGRTLLAAPSGWVADHVGWVEFFLTSTLLALPGLAILGWMMHRFPAPATSGGGRNSTAPGTCE